MFVKVKGDGSMSVTCEICKSQKVAQPGEYKSVKWFIYDLAEKHKWVFTLTGWQCRECQLDKER